MSVCPNHSWDFYSYSTDAGPVFVGFHTQSNRVDQDKYPHCARVTIPILTPNANGGPNQTEAEVLWAMEDCLVEVLNSSTVPCLLLGRLTHGGVRELVFQVADYTPFRATVGRWTGQYKDYVIDVSEHDGWDFYFESVWPDENSWLLIMDRRVVDSLVESGSDPEKPHSLDFVFRGDTEKLEKMQAALAGRGYSLGEFDPAESRLVMSRSMVLNVGTIFQESRIHKEDSKRLSIEYDGWGATVVS